ncbi:hypothetical protein B296_00016786 [Ensete ventricosum]|uniref:Uncharacterized protein n=1 Tax=Ensete ventricosum TaxID=4639 RepID=A0A426ZPQ7_ENSVE|nr:hypothetical protein B296_00016786 [Ensete ventricosum]
MRGSRLCRSNNHEEGALEWLILLWRERRHWMCAAEGWPAESTRIRCGLKEKVTIVAGEGYCYCYRQLCGKGGYVGEEVDNKVPARLTEKARRLLQNDDAVEGWLVRRCRGLAGDKFLLAPDADSNERKCR